MKLLYSDKKTGLTASMELDDEKAAMLLNRKIGSEIDGGSLGLPGYTLKITGGSDDSGFPLDRSIAQEGKLRVMRQQRRKHREIAVRRVMVRGNSITGDTRQVSAIITQYGSRPIEEIFPKKEKKEEGK